MMDVQGLTRDKVREILRASEGINTQLLKFKAHRDKNDGHFVPATIAHPIGEHLLGANPLADTKGNTMFTSMDDMVEALWLVLHSPVGVSTLRGLKVGPRPEIKASVGRLFAFGWDMPDAQSWPTTHKVKFSIAEQIRVGWSATTCLAVVEVRERAQVQHLQVHTFYPKYTKPELQDTVRERQSQR